MNVLPRGMAKALKGNTKEWSCVILSSGQDKTMRSAVTSAQDNTRLYELVLGNGCSISPWRIRFALAHKASRGHLNLDRMRTFQPGPSKVWAGLLRPPGIRSRIIDNNNGVKMHILESGFQDRNRPWLVLLHGFPELAYTWRNQLLPLAQAGFHVIAPDLRGYGRSVKTPVIYDDDISQYSCMNLVSDMVGLVRALGCAKVAGVIGHDWGSPVAAWCALMRPDVFQSVVLVSTPFGRPRKAVAGIDIDGDLAALPRPRKRYSSYWATRGVNEDMWRAPQGVHDLLRALYYFKSADWKGNKPFPLKSWSATELAKMPEYYIMDLDKTTAETMAVVMPSKAQIAACKWMSEKDLQVYSSEYLRTGFQGGLNYYRGDLTAFAGRTIDVPACYIAGASEWGVYQTPGAFEAMQHGACTRLMGVHLVKDAGHSVVEEQAEQVTRLLKDFLHQVQT